LNELHKVYDACHICRQFGVNFINIVCTPFSTIFFCKKLQSQNVIREKLLKAFSYEKFEQTMLMKLTIGFTNIFLNLPILQLRADFDAITYKKLIKNVGKLALSFSLIPTGKCLLGFLVC